MSDHSHAAHDDHSHDHKPGFFARWFCSTNHKDIGTLYIIFSIMAGLIGGAFSVIMRMELQEPGLQYIAEGSGISGMSGLQRMVLSWCSLL